jgi:hypothetical protein
MILPLAIPASRLREILYGTFRCLETTFYEICQNFITFPSGLAPFYGAYIRIGKGELTLTPSR